VSFFLIYIKVETGPGTRVAGNCNQVPGS